ncbi:N-6 DNA methylase [Lysinibacillus sphaericus]|uniref:N-6 DNA methylase n=1 Tax=Lysinibacillus sphaericus TaxID=1421 RepID=UPI000C17998C|nr:N-6 DNA methylase [Lysinibacillus sphaericus]PIJ98194.1 helicase [Lysinibacillus sphaericus]
MKYNNNMQIIPQEQRKSINDKILYLIDNNETSKFNITPEDIYNAYTGDGGLHDLEFNNYSSYHAYSEAKKEIENGQFFTPAELAEFLVECIRPSKYDLIVDLTSGMGSFFNFLPNELNVYGNEIDLKAFKVARFLYEKATLTNQDIRSFKSEVLFDIVLGNPPFNLKWKVGENKYLSQLYYCMKSHEVLKAGGIMGLIVPMSFLADDFTDSGMINEINSMFDFIGQVSVSEDAFASLGVTKYPTKIMLFQKKSEHLPSRPYQHDLFLPYSESNDIFEKVMKPVKEQLKEVRVKIGLENRQKVSSVYEFKKSKLLFDIKRHPKLQKHYANCVAYAERLITQEKPKGMDETEWQLKKVTENKVLSYLRQTLKKQHKSEDTRPITLVKTKEGLKYRAYTAKDRKQLKARNLPPVLFGTLKYPFPEQTYRKLFDKKRKAHELQETPFSKVKPYKEIVEWFDELIIYDHSNGEEIRLNDIQREDTAKMLMKRYGYLQWGTGAGKSISAVAQMKYRLENKQVRNVFIVAPAIAINNNWDDILENYGFDYIRIHKMVDIQKIERGQIVILTFGMLTKYERQLKRFMKLQSQKIMLLLDEADAISNPSSKRAKATLNVFRRVKIKQLMSATSTRNSIPESFTAFELLYNNSRHMLSLSPTITIEDRKTGDLNEKVNPYKGMAFPPYKKGHMHFKRTFSPERATVFGIGKLNQDIYNASYLNDLINKSMITRTFEEVSGKDIYKLIQNTVKFNTMEQELYRIVVEEFYKLTYLFNSTGNSRKDSMLRIIQQLNSLLKACVNPQEFKEYKSSQLPSKAVRTLEMINQWDDDYVVIGCTHIKTVEYYQSFIKDAFPDRPIFVITGDKVSLNRRKTIIKELKASKRGILICTQQSLSSSMNIDFVNNIVLIEMLWNYPSMHQFFARFIRYTSKEQKEVHFVTVENSIESNMLQLIIAKEKLNNFMKNETIDEQEILDKFGIDFDLIKMLLSKEKDSEGKSYIKWGQQLVC